MPLNRLLNDTAFEPEAIEAMGRAYGLLGDWNSETGAIRSLRLLRSGSSKWRAPAW